MNDVLNAVAALIPPAGVCILFVVAIRAIVHADRRERAARAREDALLDGDRGAELPPGENGRS